jgi:hypothetical protein
VLGIRPWEWDLMTVEQEEAVFSVLEQYKKDQDEAEAEAKRR